MALVTIQRSPTPSTEDNGTSDIHLIIADTLSEICQCSSGTPGSQRSVRSAPKQRSLGECYFAVKGAAVILPQNECVMMPRQSNSSGGDIQLHLQAMLRLLRSQDTLKMAVRLESMLLNHTRYMAIVSTMGRQDNQESILLGIDYVSPDDTTIGLVLPIWASTILSLDGDGGICVESAGSQHIFKPMSVQAMWSAYQSLHKEVSLANTSYPYFPGGLTHTWVQYYESQITSKEAFRSEWHYAYNDDTDLKAPSIDRYKEKPPEKAAAERMIRSTLKDIMQSVDLDEVTSKDIRQTLEERLNMNLNEFKEFVDQEMLIILGQMDKPSKIFDYLYLGTEWNASNWDELRQNNVGHILNVTKEVDCFFPGLFGYMKIRVTDEESTELLKHWDSSYKFIYEAKEKQTAVLVHCKKGISRSSSTVIAYAMKAYGWPLEQALNYVKEKRNCITPNRGFMEQLRTYQGILEASQHRKSALFNQLQFVPPQPELVPWDGLTDVDAENCKKVKVDDRTCIVSNKFDAQPATSAPRLLIASENILKSGPSHVVSSCSTADDDDELLLNDNEIHNIQTSTGYLHLQSKNTTTTQIPQVQTGIVSNFKLKFEPSADVGQAKTNGSTYGVDINRPNDEIIEVLTLNYDQRTTAIDEDMMPNLTSRLPIRRQLQNVERNVSMRDGDLTLKNVQEILMRRSSNSLTSDRDSSSLSSGDESDLSGTGGATTDGSGAGVGLKERRNSKSSSGDSAVADLTGVDSSLKNSSAETLSMMMMAQSCPSDGFDPSSSPNRIEILPLDPTAKAMIVRRPLSVCGQLETSASCPIVVPVGQVKRVTRQYELGFSKNCSTTPPSSTSSFKTSTNRRSSPALMNLNESDDDDDDDEDDYVRYRETEMRRRTKEELKMVQQTRKSQSISGDASKDADAVVRHDLPPTGKRQSRKLFERFFRKDGAAGTSQTSSNPQLSTATSSSSGGIVGGFINQPQKLNSLKPTAKWYHEVCKRAEKSYRNRPKSSAPPPAPPPPPPPQICPKPAVVVTDSCEMSIGAVELNKVSLKVSQPGKVKHQKEQIERLSYQKLDPNSSSLSSSGKHMASGSSWSSSSSTSNNNNGCVTKESAVKKITNDLETRSAHGAADRRSVVAGQNNYRLNEECNNKLVRSLVDVFEPNSDEFNESDAFSLFLTPAPWRRTGGGVDEKSPNYNIRRVGSFNSIGWRHVGSPQTERHVRSKSLNRHSNVVNS